MTGGELVSRLLDFDQEADHVIAKNSIMVTRHGHLPTAFDLVVGPFPLTS